MSSDFVRNWRRDIYLVFLVKNMGLFYLGFRFVKSEVELKDNGGICFKIGEYLGWC